MVNPFSIAKILSSKTRRSSYKELIDERQRARKYGRFVCTIDPDVRLRYVISPRKNVRVTDCDLYDNKCLDFTASGSINSTLLSLPGFPPLTGHKGR